MYPGGLFPSPRAPTLGGGVGDGGAGGDGCAALADAVASTASGGTGASSASRWALRGGPDAVTWMSEGEVGPGSPRPATWRMAGRAVFVARGLGREAVGG